MNFGKTGWRLTAMIGTNGHTSGIVTVDGTEKEKSLDSERSTETKCGGNVCKKQEEEKHKNKVKKMQSKNYF